MAPPNRTGAGHWHYHVYDIPCGHPIAVAGHVAGTCGPHQAQAQFLPIHIASWLPVPAAGGGVAATDHTARADLAARGAEAAPLVGVNIDVHPALANDSTANERLSLRQDMEDLDASADGALHVDSRSIGQTYFGREIPCIMFGGNGVAGGYQNAPQVLLTGGIHAREWIAVEVPYLIAEYLIKNYIPPPLGGGPRVAGTPNQRRISEVLDSCRICVIPMLNPDGHCWSVASTQWGPHGEFRRWRRNRRRWSRAGLGGRGMRVDLPALGATWTGVDCNRNFPRRGGGNWPRTNPTREDFAGPKQASEAETRLLLDFISAHLPNLAGSIDYHSAMGRVFYHGDAATGAWRFRRKHTRKIVRYVARCMWRHISAYHVLSSYGAGPTTIEEISAGEQNSYGSVMDCCYDIMSGANRVPLAYTIELDPIRQAGNTHRLPDGTIIPHANRDQRWFRIDENGIQHVFEKNLTPALCLIRHASESPQLDQARRIKLSVRRAAANVVQAFRCPFVATRWNTVVKVNGQGNQAPLP